MEQPIEQGLSLCLSNLFFRNKGTKKLMERRGTIAVSILSLLSLAMAFLGASQPVEAQSQPYHVHYGIRCGVLVEHYTCAKRGYEYNCIPYDYSPNNNKYKCFHATE
jgi:hypothetical protein